jgi:hypothetical protein
MIDQSHHAAAEPAAELRQTRRDTGCHGPGSFEGSGGAVVLPMGHVAMVSMG